MPIQIAFAIDDDRHGRWRSVLRRIEAFHARGPVPAKVVMGNAAVRTIVAHSAPSAVNCRRAATSSGSRRASRSLSASRPLRVRQWRGAAHPVGQPHFTLRAFGQRRHLRPRCRCPRTALARRAHQIFRPASTQNLPRLSCSTHCTRCSGRPAAAGSGASGVRQSGAAAIDRAAQSWPSRSWLKRGTTPTGTPCSRP